MRPGGRRSERGASFVEYVLMLGLAGVVVIGAATYLSRVADEQYDGTASNLASGSGEREEWRDPAPEGGGGGTGGGSGPTPSPSTTPPSSTTTTRPAVRASAAVVDTSSRVVYVIGWEATVTFRVTGDGGGSLVGAQVTVRITQSNGSSDLVTAVVDANGEVTVSRAALRYTVGQIDFALAGIEGDGVSWDGRSATASVRAP